MIFISSTDQKQHKFRNNFPDEELRKKPREVKMAKFLRDGNLLMCTKQKSRETKQSRWKVSARRVLGVNTVVRSVITGVPVDEDST